MPNKNKSMLDSVLLRDKKQLTIIIISLLILAIAAPIKSYAAQWLVDAREISKIAFAVVCCIIVIAISHVSEYIARSTFNKVVTRSETDVRGLLCSKLSAMSLEQVNKLSKEEWRAAYTNDLKLICDDYYTSIFNIAMWGSIGVVSAAYMAVISPVLLLVSMFLIAFPLLGPRLVGSKLSKTKTEYAKSYNTVCTKIGELLNGFETLVTCNSAAFGLRKLKDVSNDNVKKDFRMKDASTQATILSSLITWVPGFTITVTGAMLVALGKIEISQLITANTLLNFMISPLRMVSNSYMTIKSTKQIKARIDGLLDLEIASGGSSKLDKVSSVDINNIYFAYDATDVLKSLSLNVKNGEKAAIVGASGSGKSTILKLLGRFYLGYRGSIRIGKEELRALSDEAFYANVGYIAQEPFIFEDTIRNNICLGGEYSEAEINNALAKAELTELVESLPDGIDTVLTENGANVSGGQKKRIAIARALIRSCDMLLIDEVTSSLDIETTGEIVRLLLSLPCTVIMITHDIFDSYMDGFSKIYYVEGGKIAEQGTFQELLKLDGGFCKMKNAMMMTQKE